MLRVCLLVVVCAFVGWSVTVVGVGRCHRSDVSNTSEIPQPIIPISSQSSVKSFSGTGNENTT